MSIIEAEAKTLELTKEINYLREHYDYDIWLGAFKEKVETLTDNRDKLYLAILKAKEETNIK